MLLTAGVQHFLASVEDQHEAASLAGHHTPCTLLMWVGISGDSVWVWQTTSVNSGNPCSCHSISEVTYRSVDGVAFLQIDVDFM